MDRPKLTTPTIHLNGSSRESLLEGLCEAGAALREAVEALVFAAPNGRDYYPQGADAFTHANKEHLSRLERLQSVKAELEEIAEAIAEAP